MVPGAAARTSSQLSAADDLDLECTCDTGAEEADVAGTAEQRKNLAVGQRGLGETGEAPFRRTLLDEARRRIAEIVAKVELLESGNRLFPALVVADVGGGAGGPALSAIGGERKEQLAALVGAGIERRSPRRAGGR